jgi:hypothetical protein
MVFQVIENFCDMHVQLNKYATSVLTILICLMVYRIIIILAHFKNQLMREC